MKIKTWQVRHTPYIIISRRYCYKEHILLQSHVTIILQVIDVMLENDKYIIMEILVK